MVDPGRGKLPRATPEGRQVVAEARGVLWALGVRATRASAARGALTRRGVHLGCRSACAVDDAWVVPVAGGQEARLQQVATRLPSSALPSLHRPRLSERQRHWLAESLGEALEPERDAPQGPQDAAHDDDDGAWGQ